MKWWVMEVFHAGLWGVRQLLSWGQAPARAKEEAENWDEAGKRKWHRGLAAIGAASRTGGLVAQAGKRHDGRKSSAKKEMGTSCSSRRGPSAPGCPHKPWCPKAEGTGSLLGSQRQFVINGLADGCLTYQFSSFNSAFSIIPGVHILWDLEGLCPCGRDGRAYSVVQTELSVCSHHTHWKEMEHNWKMERTVIITMVINSVKLNTNMWQRSVIGKLSLAFIRTNFYTLGEML